MSEELAPIAPSDAIAPAEELGVLVGWATVLFFAAEEGHNPQVTTIWDAYHYIATSLSVGYANIFPVTAMGKAIGAVVMTVGPAMSGKALDTERNPPRDGTSAASPGRGQHQDDAAILAKLDELIRTIRAK